MDECQRDQIAYDKAQEEKYIAAANEEPIPYKICPVCYEEKPPWLVMCWECFDKVYDWRNIYVVGPFGQAVRIR